MAEVMIRVKGYECERCTHQWAPRRKDKPTVCPTCKSPYWNKRKKKS
ncbi:MAG: hypothetical protein Q7S56_02925 [Nanoarchaeota archaeon]|nr:hypothetical protein [Nanoarchaeota archaeon]